MRTLNKKKPWDRQYIYMAPGGDHGIHKDLMTQPLEPLWMRKMGEVQEKGFKFQRKG